MALWGDDHPAAESGPLDDEVKLLADELARQLILQCRDAFAGITSANGVCSLSFQFLPRAEVNAYAFRQGDDAFVAISLGTLSALLSASHKVALAEDLPILITRLHGLAIEPTRFARFMTVVGINYLAAHEVGHHVYGHFNHLSGIPAVFDELDSSQLVGDRDLMERQALELHADAFALAGSLAHIKDEQWQEAAMDVLGLDSPAQNAYEICSTGLTLALMTVFLLLRQASELDPHKRVVSRLEHPTPHLRLLNALTALNECDPAVPAASPDSVARLLFVLSNVNIGTRVKDSFYQNNDALNSDKCEPYLKLLMQRAKALHDELAPQRWR